MSDLICRKTMMRCPTQGMCAPFGGCQAGVLVQTDVRYAADAQDEPAGEDVRGRIVAAYGKGRWLREYDALVAERDQLRAEVDRFGEGLGIAQRHRDELLAEVEALRKDAERYRWLREQHEDGDADYAVMKFSRRANEWIHLDWKLDAEIDAGVAAKEG